MFPIGDKNKLSGLAFFTYVLIAINVYVFYLELSVPDLGALISRYALIPSQLNLSETANLLPLITSQFLHGGWFHLLTNVWFLAVFGPNLERAWGQLRFLIYYLLAGVLAAAVQLMFTVNPDVPILGASGAIAGVLGAYFVYFPHHRITTLIPIGFIPLFVGVPAGIILLYWFGLQLAGGFFVEPSSFGGVAFFAHIGGFLAGVILAAITKPRSDVVGSDSPFS